MCGIAGYWSAGAIDPEDGSRLGTAMARAMRKRGPDHQNVRVFADDGLVLSHARLSVIDLSSAANQPFVSSNGRSAIVYNGEIYNFRELREELMHCGCEFQTQSDTEVVLQACRHWGVRRAVQRFVGMFAFAYWDADARSLHLARDPVGIKPLYYGVHAGTFLFSSTLAALRDHPAFVGRISKDALAAYFRHSYVPAPHSIFEGIWKLPPGHLLSLSEQREQTLECYWDALAVARKSHATTLDAPDTEILSEFEALLRTSVRGCMISDVPLGAFLSGGIDSSLVTALMQAQSGQAVKTFTVGFSDPRFDESGYARQVASHLGCDHTEVVCTTEDALALIPDIPDCYDEPFADSSQIPTLLLSRLTRQSVTVALSGDGGDELFGGYDRYYWMERLRQFSRPRAAGHLLAWVADRFPRGTVFPLLRRISKNPALVPKADEWYHLARMARRAGDYGYLYRTTPMSVCALRDRPLLAQEAEPASILDDRDIQRDLPDLIDWMQFVDQQTYLPDDILQKVDRASMAYSLEARVPLLDHRVVEFAWKVPGRLKLKNKRGKILMRELLARYLPSSLIERPKRGFSVPLSAWLKGNLREWADALIESHRTRGDPLLDAAGVKETWHNFLTGRAEHTLATVWNLLMYLSWSERLSCRS